jgi:hypothetical protein
MAGEAGVTETCRGASRCRSELVNGNVLAKMRAMSVQAAQSSSLSVDVVNRVCWATIDLPPANIMTIPLLVDLMKLANVVAADDTVGALVLQSADPDFFIAHFDVEAILKILRRPCLNVRAS